MPSTRFFHFLLFSLLLPLTAHARIWHVNTDATGANTGLTWVDAFSDLQDGLRAAVAGDEV